MKFEVETNKKGFFSRIFGKKEDNTSYNLVDIKIKPVRRIIYYTYTPKTIYVIRKVY